MSRDERLLRKIKSIKKLERETAEIKLTAAIIGLFGSISEALLIFFTYNRNMPELAVILSTTLIIGVIVSLMITVSPRGFNWPWIQSELYGAHDDLNVGP
ncbi:MAG: hypothetical protein J7L47_02165 [Candidatus Odinarchaeota archaeon]|nr:hypothetical protein [Candidatus Odinarchaeota archaeon]